MTRVASHSLLVLATGSAFWLCCNNPNISSGVGEDDVAVNPNGLFSDFPSSAIIDPSGPMPVPANASSLFGSAGSGNPSGGPCLSQPEIGALIPRDWLRMRFSISAPAGQNIYELRVHTDNQTSDLVVYTTATQWTMPAGMWSSLAQHSADRPIHIAVRSGQLSGPTLLGHPSLGTVGDVTIAPVNAGGSIVYWTTSNGSVLRGFKIGEETVHDVLRPTQATPPNVCVGCHSSTPDGIFVAFSQAAAPNQGDNATVGLRTVDGQATEPAFLTASARALLLRPRQELPTFSAAHWGPGDHIAMTAFAPNTRWELNWTDLEATSQTQGTGWGILARKGDANQVSSPVFSHSGQSIVYVSDPLVSAGSAGSNGDLYTVPYNNRMGGAATPVLGASAPGYNEFYPAYSSDDSLLAFSRLPTGLKSYNNPHSEVFVVPTAGGTATRLVGNDPPSCSGKVSPGVTNSWPKWAPQTQQVNGRQYYWVSFSSTRSGIPQLYVIGLVVQNGTIKTYKALYLWNQPATESNHTAAWDVFKIVIG